MKTAAIHCNNSSHQREHAAWISAGLSRHGFNCQMVAVDEITQADLEVVWGWRQRSVINRIQNGIPVLVMERGHLQPRMQITSCGFNGLGYRGIYANPRDRGIRWNQMFSHLMRPWSSAGGRAALIFGQVEGDASLWGVNFKRWSTAINQALLNRDYQTIYRAHPLTARGEDRWHPPGALFSDSSRVDIETDLARADLAVAYNSTACVESVLAGVRTITIDQGAMSWPVTSHAIDEPIIAPDRDEWAHALAWTTYTRHEIESGFVWEVLKTCEPAGSLN